MKVKLLADSCSPFGSYVAGMVIDLPDDVALGLLQGGYAEPERSEPEIKTASLTKPKKTAKRK